MVEHETVQVTVRLGLSTVEWLDEQATEMGLSRAGLIRYLVTQYRERERQRPRLEALLGKSMEKAIELYNKGQITLEDLKSLEDDASESTGA